jgi:hypothetical protein
MEIEKQYDPDEIKNQKSASYILDDNGFTIVSNGKDPFFSLFPEPSEGYGHFLNDKEDLQKIFAALSHTDTMNALIYLYRKRENYVFESSVLARDCDISDDKIDTVLDNLSRLKVIRKQILDINCEERTLYYEGDAPECILSPRYERRWQEWTSYWKTKGQPVNLDLQPLYQIGDKCYTVYFPVKKMK